MLMLMHMEHIGKQNRSRGDPVGDCNDSANDLCIHADQYHCNCCGMSMSHAHGKQFGSSERNYLLSRRCITANSRGVSNMLVITTTVRMLHGIHSNTTHLLNSNTVSTPFNAITSWLAGRKSTSYSSFGKVNLGMLSTATTERHAACDNQQETARQCAQNN